MAKFKANTDGAYILTNIQNQESGDSDWVKYQVVTKDNSRLILHNNTTNSLLKVNKYATQVHDIFGDGSAIATYTLDGNANDLGGNYNGTWSGTEQYDTGVFGQSAKFDGSSKIECGVVNNSLDELWVSFWINWSGSNNETPVGFSIYNIRINDGYIGWNTGNSDVYGTDFPSSEYANKWTFIVVNFKTGEYGNILYIDNVIQTLSQKQGSIASNNAIIKDVGFNLGDRGGSTSYAFNGLIDQVRIFNRALTEDEVAFLYHEGLVHIRKHDQLIIYNATEGAKIHEVTSITDNDTDKTYDIDISSLSLTEAPTNAHQLTKSVDLTDKIDTSNTTATTLVLQDALENSTLVKKGETLVIDGYKLENINVTRSLEGENVKYSVDISSLNRVPSEVVLIKPRVEISIGDENKANADDLVLDVDTNNTTTTQIVTNYMSVNDSQRTRIKNIGKIDADTGLDIQVTNVTEEGDGGSPEKFKYTIELAETQSSAPTKAIIRPTIQDILEIDPNNTAYDNTNDLVNVYYQPIQKGNGFRSVQVKWNAHRQGDENSSLRVNLWKKVA